MYRFNGNGRQFDDGSSFVRCANKKDCLIIDLAGNVERFGKVEDIVFEKDTIWRMYGTGGKLLSGLPIHELGKVTRTSLASERTAKQAKQTKLFEIMPFGKYKGEPIKDIPADYRQWMLNNFDWHAGNENLRQSILATI